MKALFKERKIWVGGLIALLVILAVGFVLFQRNSLKFPALSEFQALNSVQQNDTIKKLATADPQATWKFLKSAFIVNGEVEGNAHWLAHLVGNMLYAKYGLDGITKCDPAFAYGCFHGVTEKLLADQGVAAVQKVQARCLQIFPPDKSQDSSSCIHGMGHGLLSWEKYSVPQALKDCDMLDTRYQTYCYDGVFMERAKEVPQTTLSDKEIWSFCENLNSAYQYNCARYQSNIFFTKYPNDIARVGSVCRLEKDSVMRNTCIETLGYVAAQNSSGALLGILHQCGLIPIPDRYQCEIAATREVIFQRYAGFDTTSASLCAQMPAAYQTQCTDARNQIKTMYNDQ